jgi:uncharacterized protein YuzE
MYNIKVTSLNLTIHDWLGGTAMTHSGISFKHLVYLILISALLLTPTMAEGVTPGTPEVPIAEGWRADRADSQVDIIDPSQHSLRLDADGYACIAYGGDHLYYAHYNGTSWLIQMVDNNWGVGSAAALALDSSGYAHISYYDRVNHRIKYATNKTGSWVRMNVVTGIQSPYSDIAIDSFGYPKIIYFNENVNKLYYTYYDSVNLVWLNEIISTAYEVEHGNWFSFAINTAVFPNTVHVSFYWQESETEGEISYAYRGSDYVWHNNVAVTNCLSDGGDCRIGEYNSIALDPLTQYPAIAMSFHDPWLAYDVGFFYFNGFSFVQELLGEATPTYISLAYDTAGATPKARIAWKEGGLKYSYRNGADSWSTVETLDANAGAGTSVSLAVIGALAKVVHQNLNTGTLIFIDHTRTGWQPPYQVVMGHEVGSSSSIAVDTLGLMHISYYDNTADSLRYLKYGINQGSIVSEEIISGGTIGRFSIIKLNSSNYPIVGYWDGGFLRYRKFNGTFWAAPQLADSDVDGALFSDQPFGMDLDSNGNPHFAYYKSNDLWYSYWTGAGWSRTLIVDETATGYQVALAMGPGNQPSIAYYEGSTLYHWTKNFLDIPIIELIGSGWKVNIDVDKNGKVMAVYLEPSGSILKFRSRGNICNGAPTYSCIWNPEEIVDPHGEEEFSFALDNKGRPHVASFAWTVPFQLNYITKVGTNWVLQVLYTNNDVVHMPSIALSPSGMPRISHYDWLNHYLMLAYKLDKVFLPLVRK